MRWTAGVTCLDHVRNVSIRQRFGLASIADKLHEARLRWYGMFFVRMATPSGIVALNIHVARKPPDGRPRQRWLDTMHMNLKKLASIPIKRLIVRSGAVTLEEWTPPLRDTNAEEKGKEPEPETY